MRLIALLFLLISHSTFAQNDSLSVKENRAIGVKLNYGNIYIHTRSVSNVAGSRPFGAELEYTKQRISDSVYNLCGCYPRSGFAAGYVNFDNPILGHGVMLSYFLEPNFRISNALSLHLKGNAGLAYLTDPFDAVKNPSNRSYVLHLNPYFEMGVGANIRLSKHLSLVADGNFQHVSNGGQKEPNRGINWVSASAGILYYPNSNELPKYKRRTGMIRKPGKSSIDAGVLFVPGQGYSSYLKGTRNYLVGAFMQYTKPVTPTSAITGGGEIYYSKIISPDISTNIGGTFAGIHAGHAFLLNKIRFSQQFGVYLYQQNTLFKPYYLRFGLDYQLLPHWLVGANLKAHTDNADFFDVRVGFRF